MTIKLGQKVRDRITGFIGIAIARTEWINGCIRIAVQAPVDKDGKHTDALSFDEPQVEVLDAQNILAVPEEAQHKAAKKKAVGGPYPEPKRAAAPR